MRVKLRPCHGSVHDVLYGCWYHLIMPIVQYVPYQPSPSTVQYSTRTVLYPDHVRWPRSGPRTSGGVLDRPLRTKRMQSSSTHSRGRWASLPSVQTPACTCGCFPAFRSAARVCRLAVRRTKTNISKKQNEKITVAMALGPVRLSLRIATTASTCRGGHVRDPKHVPG
jgi:hypothetical protein